MYAQTLWTKRTPPTLCSSNLNNLETQYETAAKIGSIIMYPGIVPPTNYFLCDGASYNTVWFSWLFDVIGYTFGNPGGGNYKVPDLRGKFIVGYNPASNDYKTMGGLVGSSEAILTENHIPSHLHDLRWGGGPASNLMGGAQSFGARVQDPTNLSTGAVGHPNVPQSVVLSYIIRYM